jgi:hypothetical protein
MASTQAGTRLEQDIHSFVIRIWHEEIDPQGRIVYWRGTVDHVSSGKRAHFSDIEGLIRFIEQQTGLARGIRVGWWERLTKWLHLIPD